MAMLNLVDALSRASSPAKEKPRKMGKLKKVNKETLALAVKGKEKKETKKGRSASEVRSAMYGVKK